MMESDKFILGIELNHCFPKNERRKFTVTYGDRNYILEADSWTTLDLAWASQKCWFSPGSVVTIADDNNNAKTFEKE